MVIAGRAGLQIRPAGLASKVTTAEANVSFKMKDLRGNDKKADKKPEVKDEPKDDEPKDEAAPKGKRKKRAKRR